VDCFRPADDSLRELLILQLRVLWRIFRQLPNRMWSVEDLHMSAKPQFRSDLFLLLSLLLVILLNPVLDHGDWPRLVLGEFAASLLNLT
jgi:hypothetical protein